MYAYQDALFVLAADKGIHNGSPALHARLLAALEPQLGDRIVHVGAGTGYYTAILAELVGPAGHVYAVEIDDALASRARTALADRNNVTVIAADGAQWEKQAADAVYVNFGVARPADAWIEALRPGGRLVMPLGVPGPARRSKEGRHASHGVALRIERHLESFSARWVGPAFFVCATGQLATDADQLDALTAAFTRGGVEFVESLIWKAVPPVERCWYVGKDWALCYDEN